MAWWEHVFKVFFLLKKVVSFAVVSIDKEWVSLWQFDSLPFVRVCLVSVRDIDFIFVGVLRGNSFFLSFVSIIAINIRCGVDVTRRVTWSRRGWRNLLVFVLFFIFWLFPLAEGVSYGVFLWFFDWERVPAMSAGVLVWFVSKLNREDTSVSWVLGSFPARVFFIFFLLFWPFSVWFFVSSSSLSDGWECFWCVLGIVCEMFGVF